MKPVIIIAIAFVLLVPIGAYATGHYQEAGSMNPEDAKALANEMLLEDIPVSIWTDKTDYGHNDMIMVTGQVANVTGSSVTLTVVSPLNSIVTIDSLPVFIDGSFETTLNTAGALWKYDGTYTIKADYGSAEKSSSVKIELTGGVSYSPEYSTPTSNYPTMKMDSPGVFVGTKPVSLSDVTMLLSYSIGATIKNISTENVEFVFHMETDDGVNKNEAWHDNLIMKPGQEHTPGFGWVPKSSGYHTITFHLWNNVNEKQDLASPVSLKVDVKEPKLLEGFEKFICEWGNKQTSDLEFLQNIQTLLNQKELILPPLSEDTKIKDYDPTRPIPDGVRNNAIWWCDSSISYENLENALSFLVREGNLSLEDTSIEKQEVTEPEPEELGIASFVDKSKDPQSYIDRYNNEPEYKKWFHDNYSQYDSIEQAVGLELVQKIPDWVKNIFGWYAQDQVSEDELLNAIKYLINEKILIVN